MKKNRNHAARASALQLTLALALMSISAILLASSFNAAQSTVQQQVQSDAQEFAPDAEAAPDAPLIVGTCDTAGPIEVESTLPSGPTAYPTLKDAFDAINLGTHQGVISIDVCGNTAETLTAVLNASGTGPTYTSVTMNPVGGPRIIEGTIVGAIIKLNGADNVTIDGRIGGTGIGRDLTVRNNSTAAATAAIWLASVAAGNGASNNVIRNLEVAAGATANVNANATFGILMCGTTISATANGVDNDNNQFIFNRVIRARLGIVTRGTTTDLNINPVVTDNIVGPSAFGPDEIGQVGILMQSDTGAIVSRNTVQFVGGALANTTAGADRVGIGIGLNSWASNPTPVTSDNYTVTNNVIHDVIDERTFSAVGIILANTTGSATPTNSLVANNFIYNVRADGTAGDAGVGIGIAGGGNDRVVFNSISMTGDIDPVGSAVATQNTAGIRVANANSASHFGLLLQNNSIYVDVNSNTIALLHYDIVVNSATYAFLGGSGGLDYNNYYFPPGNGQMRTGGIGTTSVAASSFLTLANWQAALTPAQDANSKQADPLYLSNTADLHIPLISPNVDVGLAVAGVTDDIDGNGRPIGSGHDIGADEAGGPTPTPTATPPPTPTPTPTPFGQTPTPSPTPTPSATPSPTPTATPTPIACSSGILFENFDSVIPPVLPSGWTANNASGVAPLWVTTATTPDSAPNAAFIDDPATASDKRLDSVPITIVNPGVQLSFRNNYALEGTFDGGVLEIKIGGGPYTDILAAGGSFVSNGYTGLISTIWSNPIAGRMAWTGSSTSYITTIANLPAAATGQTIILRWRMGSDVSISNSGWRVDTIQLFCDGGAPTPTPTPTPTGTPTPTPTPAPPYTLDHFKAYVTAGPLPPNPNVQLQDQFDLSPQPGQIAPPFRFLTPVQKIHNGVTNVVNPFEHLMMYPLQNMTAPTRLVKVFNQFGMQDLTLGQPVFLGVPTWKQADGGPVHVNDHFKFYDATGVSLNIPVGLVDQFINDPGAQVLQPRYFANPVRKIHGPNDIPIAHPNDHLVCYQLGAQPIVQTPRPTFNQFDNILVQIGPNSDLLCVPSEKLAFVTCPSPSKIFHENYDLAIVPALPPGWSATNVVNNDPTLWVTSNAGVPTPVANTAPNSAFINDPASVNDKVLDTPLIPIASVSARVTFQNNYSLEPVGGGASFFDGGVLEVSSPNINAGAFTDITAAAVGGSFVTGGYNGTISTQFGSPIAGRTAWSQSSGGFITTTANLGPNVAGQSIRLRFRMGSDTTLTGNGWRVDDVNVIDCLGGPTPTPPTVNISGNVFHCASPAPTPTPPPAGTPTPTPAATPPVSGVTMTLTGTSGGSTTTDGAGNYSFTGLASGGSYTVTPSKGPLSPGSGLNTQDVLAAQRHFLAITIIPAGCRLTAADAVINGSVNTQDVLAIQRFFLAFATGTGSAGQYKFVPVNYSYVALGTSQTGQNFAMYVVGDCAAGFVARDGGPSPDVATGNDQGLSRVATVSLPEVGTDLVKSEFTAAVSTSAIDASQNLVGFQGDFTFDERVVKFADEPVQNAGVTGGNWTVAGNVLPGRGPIRTLRVSAFSNDTSVLSGSGALFELRITGVNTGAGGTPLVWAAAPNNFIFINADLEALKPGNAVSGSIAPRPTQR